MVWCLYGRQVGSSLQACSHPPPHCLVSTKRGMENTKKGRHKVQAAQCSRQCRHVSHASQPPWGRCVIYRWQAAAGGSWLRQGRGSLQPSHLHLEIWQAGITALPGKFHPACRQQAGSRQCSIRQPCRQAAPPAQAWWQACRCMQQSLHCSGAGAEAENGRAGRWQAAAASKMPT